MSDEFKLACIFEQTFFTRDRVLSFQGVVTFIINFARKSLQVELNAFSDLLKKPDVSKQAFSQARQKLSAETFTLLNEQLITEFYSDNEIKTFNGFRILAVDGSTIRLPISDELYEQYGASTTENSVPMARTSVAYDVLNKVAVHAVLRPYCTAEKDMAIEHLIELKRLDATITNDNYTDDLIMYDRGYPSLFSFFFHRSLGKHFIVRCRNIGFLTETHEVLKSGRRDVIITIPAFKSTTQMHDFNKYLPDLKKDATMQIRVLVFDLPSGEKEVIVTSLLDQKLFTYENIFMLYGLRWDSEEHYKFYKVIAEIENFSGKLKLAIEQDFFATVFACNVASLLAGEAQDELDNLNEGKMLNEFEKEEEVELSETLKDKAQEETKEDKSKSENKYSYKINRNVLIGTMKNEIVQILLSDGDLDEYCNKIKKRIKRSLVAIRPDRSYERHLRFKKAPKVKRAL